MASGVAGDALGFGTNALFYGNIKDILLPKDQRSVERWLMSIP